MTEMPPPPPDAPMPPPQGPADQQMPVPPPQQGAPPPAAAPPPNMQTTPSQPPAGAATAIPEDRSPIVWWLLCCLCIPQLLWCNKVITEVNTHIKMVCEPWQGFIPLLNIFRIYQCAEAFKEHQIANGVPQDKLINPVVVLILMFVMGIGVIIFQGQLNEHWAAHRSGTASL